jgi:hypothetical protein
MQPSDYDGNLPPCLLTMASSMEIQANQPTTRLDVSPRDTRRFLASTSMSYLQRLPTETPSGSSSLLVDQLQLECDQVHIKAAFLNGNL